jgi:hypothetical protein
MAGTDKDYRENALTVAGTDALVAVRLCNFETSKAYLLTDHMAFLDSRVRPLLRNMPSAWVDIIGYASHRGDEGFNQRLSDQRCHKVRDYLAELDDANFQIVQGLGESQSGSDGEQDNSGWWRAVAVYVYGTKPATAGPATVNDTSMEFKIRLIRGGTLGAKGGIIDSYYFDIIDTKRSVGARFHYFGMGGTLPVPGLPVAMVDHGPFTPFRTTAPVRLSDFSGSAELFQDPGVAAGPVSIGGTYNLSIESRNLTEVGATVRPGIIPISGGFGIESPSPGSASKGLLKMEGTSSPR